jgi:autotransporter-associated beta strand protein
MRQLPLAPLVLAAATVVTAVFPRPVSAQSGTWSQATAGTYTWSTTGNWTGGTVANGANNTASFNTASLTGPITVTLDTSRTIGGVLFDNPTNTFGWTLGSSGTSVLTLSNTTAPTFTVSNATIPVTVSASLAGTQGFTYSGPGSMTLTANNTGLSGPITVSSGALVVAGSATINPLGTGTVTLSGGTLRLGGGTGFNQKMVVPVGTTFATSGITATMDGGTAITGNTWYELGQNTAAATTGLPMGTTITSTTNAQYKYALQPSTSRNALLLDNGGTTGRFTLTTPTANLATISFLTSSGNGAGTLTATIHYSDGTPDATGLTFTSPDWFNNTPVAINASGRINSNGYDSVGTANPNLYDEFISNPNATNLVSSIDLSWTGGATTHTAVFAIAGANSSNASVPVSVLNGDPAQTFTNNVTVTADSAIDLRSVAGGSLGNLSMGTNTLTMTGQSGTTLGLGTVTLTGNPTLSVGTGLTVTLGAFNDGGTARTITKAGPGTATLGAAAASLGTGTAVNVTGGTLNLTVAGALGTQAAVTLSPGATLNTTANQTFGALAGTGGTVSLNTNTLTVGNGAASTFAGSITGGPLVVSGSGTALTLSGANAPTNMTVQSGAKVISNGPNSLGTGVVNLANNATLTVGAVQPVTVTGFGGTGTGWNLQGTTNGTSDLPTVAADVLTITTAMNSEAHTAWYATPVPVGPFTATFRYSQSNNSNPADGITFGFQNQSGTAIGGGGGALGYQGITPSAAMTLNIYSGAGNLGPGFSTNGSAPGGYLDPTPVSLLTAQTGNEVVVTITYDGANVTVKLVQGANSFTSPAIAANLAGIVGSTAFMGFTGGTGGLNAQQVIDQFSYNFLAQSVYTTPVSIAAAASATLTVKATAATPTITLGALTFGAGSNLSVAAETGTPATQAYGLTVGATTLSGTNQISVATLNGTLTLGGVVSGSAALTTAGGGKIVMTAANTYTGNTSINGGVLALTGTGSFAGSPFVAVAAGASLDGSGVTGGANFDGTRFALANGQTLQGNGTVVGSLGIRTGSTISPGASPGRLTIDGGLTFTGGTYNLVITGPLAGTQYDQIQVMGNVALGAGVATLAVPSPTGTGFNATTRIAIITNVGVSTTTTGNFSGLPTDGSQVTAMNGLGGFNWGIYYHGNAGTGAPTGGQDVLLAVLPVPEPVTILGFAAVGLGLTGGGRRRPGGCAGTGWPDP